MPWTESKNLQTGVPEYIFDGFENGVGDSAYTGIRFMSGFNIKNYPKVAYSNIARAASTMTGGALAEEANYTIQDPTNTNCLYSVSIAGVVRQSIDEGATWTIVTAISYDSTGSGNGIFIWGAFLHVISQSDMYAIAITSAGTSGGWTRMADNASNAQIFNLTSQNNQQSHYALYCNFDKKVYICNGNWIASLAPGINPTTGALVTYDPTDVTKYTWNEQALKLNAVINTAGNFNVQRAQWLEQLQDKLIIAFGNLILPWDRASLHYDTPYPFSENIGKMINVNNIIYVFGGIPTFTAGNVFRTVTAGGGNIYYYNGFSGGFLKKIPDSLNIVFVNDPEWLIGGIMTFRNKVYFGAIASNGSPNSTGGVYSLDVSSETQALSYQVSPAPLTIETGGTSNSSFLYTTLCPTSNVSVNGNVLNYSGAYINTSATTYTYNYTDQSGARESGRLITDILQLGSNLSANTFNNVEVRFRNPLSVGETVSVQISKLNGDSGFSNALTYTAPSNSTDMSWVTPVNIQQSEVIQILLVTSPISNGSGCPIRSIIIR